MGNILTPEQLEACMASGQEYAVLITTYANSQVGAVACSATCAKFKTRREAQIAVKIVNDRAGVDRESCYFWEWAIELFE